MARMKFAKVIVNNRSYKTDMEYTYRVPDPLQDKINIGSRIIIPFGQGNKLIEGFVVDQIDSVDISLSRIKFIKKIVDKDTMLSQELVDLCKWMKEKYLCKFIDAIKCVMPAGASLKPQNIIELKETVDEACLEGNRLTENGKKIIKFLFEQHSITEDLLKDHFKGVVKENSVHRMIKELERKNFIQIKKTFKSDVGKIYKKIVTLSSEINVGEVIQKMNKRATKQIEVLQYLEVYHSVEWSKMKNKLNVSTSTIKALINKGFIKMFVEEEQRIPYDHYKKDGLSIPPILTEEQVKAKAVILPYIESNRYQAFLIHGITGSGKTEVYMQLIDKAIRQSKEAIVLVPEISLTTQMIERFKTRFGEQVAVLHSRLSLGERYDEWNRIRKGEVKIAIGPRSAVFAPFQNLGIIIVDEEHEYTYKSEYSPKYHAIEVAEFRCKKNNAVLVLGSATPSVESYTKALNQEYQKINMLRRFNDNPLPNIEIVDMRNELNSGNKTIFSRCLYEEIKSNLYKGEQTILFLNRRGYSTFISCRNCGYVVKCPHCEITLTYHQNLSNASCHYCGFTIKPPTICPTCGSKYIKYFGIGTEKVEYLTKKYFPEARVARLDLDTTSRKGRMEKIITSFKEGKIDILVGTQMIAKGLDFPNVTLVGVISADLNLNMPDFRASERTFQLITQVAGRAGRGDILGRVVVQTYEPSHFAIVASEKHDYSSFYSQEIAVRKAFFYPPYSRLINIIFTGTKENETIQAAKNFVDRLKNKMVDYKIEDHQVVFGPQPAPLSKIKQKYRWQIIIKSKSAVLDRFKDIIKDISLEDEENNLFNNVRLSVDIDPYSML